MTARLNYKTSISAAHASTCDISKRPRNRAVPLPKHFDAPLQRLERLLPTTRPSAGRAEDELGAHLPARVNAPFPQGFGAEVGVVVLEVAAETFDREGGPDWVGGLGVRGALLQRLE